MPHVSSVWKLIFWLSKLKKKNSLAWDWVFKHLFFFFFFKVFFLVGWLVFFFYFVLLGLAPAAHGGSQARGWIRATAANLCHNNAKSEPWSVTYTAAHGHARSSTHWVRSGMEPKSSKSTWILVRLVTTEPWQELPPLRCLFSADILDILSLQCF